MPTVRQRTNESTADWATDLAIDAIALAHSLTYRDALYSISKILRAARVAGQQDVAEYLSQLTHSDTPSQGKP